MLEKQIEKKVCDYAKEKGWLVFKWVSPSNRGVPDRILFREGMALAIEFKQKGKGLRTLQKAVMDKLRGAKIAAYMIDNVEDGIDMIDTFTRLLDEPSTNTENKDDNTGRADAADPKKRRRVYNH